MIEPIFMIFSDIQPGRLIESLIFLGVLIWKLQPHMKRIEDRLMGLEKGLEKLESSMTTSFMAGEQRFSGLEHRLELLDDRISNIEHKTPQGK